MTRANITAIDTSTQPHAISGVTLGALGLLAAGGAAAVMASATTASFSVHAGLSDPAVTTVVSLAIGFAALFTVVTSQRYVRRQTARNG